VDIATCGEEALAGFAAGKYDVVFMDIRMPGIDGIETARQLKAACGDCFTPVIFVSGEDDEDSLVRAIAAGGDDFLTKPVTPAILLAKLQAMLRIRALHETTRLLYARVVEDQTLAKEVFDRAVGHRAVRSTELRSSLIPAEVFGGDLLLSALSPLGRLHVLVGDFTGHGLAAALGAMPVAEAFHTMVAADMSAQAILGELNRKVGLALPRGHFLAASLLSVDPGLSTMVVANCGMPALLLCGPDGVRRKIESGTFALGVLEEATYDEAVHSIPIRRGERLILASDGVAEACNERGEAFGDARLEALLAAQTCAADGAPATVMAALDRFRAGRRLADDASIVEICFNDALFVNFAGGAAEPELKTA